MPADCLFCRIAAGEIPATKVHEADLVFAIRDINPQAPTHVLVMPLAHVVSAADLTEADASLLGRPVRRRRRARSQRGSRRRLEAGQQRGAGRWPTVDHLHVHVLGGRPMTWPPG